MTHLTSDELIDALEGLLADEGQAHLDACETCRQQLADLSAVLSEAKQASVPDPSPMFWPQFSARVNTAIEAEEAAGGGWPAWLRWQVLLPLGAVAMIILALMISVPKQESAVPEVAVEAVPVIEDNWVVLANLVGDIDLDIAAEAGVTVHPGVAEQAVLELTAEEQQELTRLLKAELTRAKS